MTTTTDRWTDTVPSHAASALGGYLPITEPASDVTVDGARALICVRESNEFDLMAFATMVRQILEPLVGRVPGVDVVLAATGEDALVMRQTPEAEALRRRWGARPLYQGTRCYGWVFEVEGTTFVFAMTSAFSDASEDLTNSFTDDFIGVAEAVRPRHLYTGPATRLVRRKDLGEQLGRRLGLLGVVVHTKELPDGINPGREPGSGQWSLLCMFAENDVRQTLTRLLTGRIFHARRNEWLAGPGALPLGFVLESGDRKIPVVGTADDVARARLLISLAARAFDQLGRELLDGETPITPEVIVKQLSDAGARKRSNKKVDKLGQAIAGAPLDTVSLARPTVMSLLEPLAAYGADGMLVRKQVLPMQGLTRHDVHGMTIYRPPGCSAEDEHRAKGVIFFQWTFPKPLDASGAEEPWADREELEKAAHYLGHLRTNDNPKDTTRQWPMSGLFNGQQNGKFFHLAYGSRGYQWRASERPAYHRSYSVAVGKFDAAAVTNGFVNALIGRLEDEGIDPRSAPITRRRPPVEPDPVSDLERRLHDLEQQFRDANAAARQARSSRSAEDHQAAADRLAEQMDELERQLRRAEGDAQFVEIETLPPDTLEVSTLATLLSVLLDTAGKPTDPSVCDALHRIVSSGTITDCWDDASPWGRFSCTVLVPTATAAVRPVDISFEVGNTSQGPDRQAFPRRMHRVLELRMASNATVEELALRLGGAPSAARVVRTLHEALVPMLAVAGHTPEGASRAASALIDCPIDSTRDVVWRLLTDGALPTTVEDLDEAETARHIEELAGTYLSPQVTWKVPSWSAGGERQRREITRWVAANTQHHQHGAPLLGLLSALGWTSSTGIAHKHLHDESAPPHDGIARMLERTSEWNSASFSAGAGRRATVADDEKRIRVRSCPHCDHRGGLIPLPCPELGVDPVLCPNCARQPSEPTRRFPASYLLPWEGPFGRSITDGRSAKKALTRTGTRLGHMPAMPSPTRARRALRR